MGSIEQSLIVCRQIRVRSVCHFFSPLSLCVCLSSFLFRATLVKKDNFWSGAILIASSKARSCLILNSIIACLTHSHLVVHIIGADVNLLFFFFWFYLNKNACPYLYMYSSNLIYHALSPSRSCSPVAILIFHCLSAYASHW